MWNTPWYGIKVLQMQLGAWPQRPHMCHIGRNHINGIMETHIKMCYSQCKAKLLDYLKQHASQMTTGSNHAIQHIGQAWAEIPPDFIHKCISRESKIYYMIY